MIKLKGPIRSPVDGRILKLIDPIQTSEEYTTIKLNKTLIIPVEGKIIEQNGPIRVLEGLGDLEGVPRSLEE